MSREGDRDSVHPLTEDFLDYCRIKGQEGGPHVPQSGQLNATKVRRVLQLTQDLSTRPFDQLRILDLGCAEGAYAIEAGLRGASVLAVDARSERMSLGESCARSVGLENVEFVQQDLRQLTPETHGCFDVIYALGILYHFDVPEVFAILEELRKMCRRIMIIDTFVSLEGPTEVVHEGHLYRGEAVREHANGDSRETRRTRQLRSLDNPFGFRFTTESLVRLLRDLGFTSVLQCFVPPEPYKPEDRTTLVACIGPRVTLSTYPWINAKSESAIRDFLQREHESD